MSDCAQIVPRRYVRGPLATPEERAAGPAPFPIATAEMPLESAYPDWRRRLAGNLSRRSDSRWEPLTYVHARADRT